MSEATIVATNIIRLTQMSPAALLGEPTNCYLVRTTIGALVVDPATPDPDALEQIETIAGEMGGFGGIAVTHGHADHTAGVAALWQRQGGWVATHPELIGKIHGVDDGAYRRIREGNRLAGLYVLETPGHKRDHVTLWRTHDGVMLVGDVVAGDGTTIINPPEGELGPYLETLRRLRDFDPQLLLPGHGPVVEEPIEALNWLIEHRMERERTLLKALDEEPQTIHQLVAHVYTDVDESLWGLAERSLLAHLIKLEREERAQQTDNGWRQVTA